MRHIGAGGLTPILAAIVLLAMCVTVIIATVLQ